MKHQAQYEAHYIFFEFQFRVHSQGEWHLYANIVTRPGVCDRNKRNV